MKKAFLKRLIFLLVLIFPSIQHSTGLKNNDPSCVTQYQSVIQSMNALPLYFVENKGQVEESVKFHLKMPDANVFLTSEEIVCQFLGRADEGNSQEKELVPYQKEIRNVIKAENIKMSFIGANEDVEVEGLEEYEAKVNYFLGNDPDNWAKGISTYQKVQFRELYPHIDLVVCGRKGRIKHEYRVKAGGEAEDIRIQYKGVENLRVNEIGQLEVSTHRGEFVEDVPLSFQVIGGRRVEVETEYVIEDKNTLKFKLGDYRKDLELVIDPEMIYSTYLGGTDSDNINGIALDGDGNAYVTGWTHSSNFPTTPDAYDTSFSSKGDVFITKLNSTGTSLLYSTYLGGDESDGGKGIAVDRNGNAYVVGWAHSSNFPTTPDAYDTSYNGGRSDAILVKLNSTGTSLLYSTYIGGKKYDGGSEIVLDGSGNIYIAGLSRSSNFPTTYDAFDTSQNGDRDIFITKLDPAGTSLLYSTYLGGNRDDWIYGLAVDGSGNALITGDTPSRGFPTTPNAYDRSFNGGYSDVFVTKLNSTGTNLLYSTYLGGSDYEGGSGIALDGSGNACVTGWVYSMDFPTTPDAYDRSFNGGYNDIFLSKLSSTGESLLYSTYLGGSGREGSCGIAVDGSDNSIIAGGTSSVDFPTTSDAFSKSLNGSNDVFIAKFNSTGTNLLYSTYLGGSESDSAYRMALDGNGNVYVIGRPSSMDFPTTPDAYDRSFNGGYSDAFVTKIQIPYLLTLSSTTGGTTDPTPGVHKYSAGTEVTITALPDVHYQFEQWSGDLSGADNPIIINMDSDKSITAHFVLINPPLNFTGQKVLNRSLSQAEYINILTWQANPNNTNVTKYRIYQIEGESQDLVIELSAGTFQHWHRKVEKDKLYTYAICAVTDEGREGQPTHITVQ